MGKYLTVLAVILATWLICFGLGKQNGAYAEGDYTPRSEAYEMKLEEMRQEYQQNSRKTRKKFNADEYGPVVGILGTLGVATKDSVLILFGKG